DHALVLVGDVAQLARQRVHDVKVRDRQQLRFAISQPSARRRSLALRTMPVAAGVVSDVRMAAGRVLAACDVAAERRRAAALVPRERSTFHALPAASGRVRLVSPTAAEQYVAPVYERMAAVTLGMFERSSDWWRNRTLADPDWQRG